MNQSTTGQSTCIAHELKHTHICLICASKNVSFSSICFCAKCDPKKHKDHRDHKGFLSVDSKSFRQKVIAFRRYLLQNSNQFWDCKSKYLNEIMDNEDLNLSDINLMKWLVSAKFWKFEDHRESKQAHESLLKLVSKSIMIPDSVIKIQKPAPLIDWSSITDEKQGSIFQQMYLEASKQKQTLQKQKAKMDILLEIFTSLQTQTKQQLLKKIEQSILLYSDDWALLLGKLYLMELHEGNKDQWLPLLKKVGQLNPKLKQSLVYIYLESHQFWVKLSKENANKQKNDIKFIDIVSGNVFKLTRPQEYTNLLNRLFVNTDKPPAILQAAKGIGLMAQGKYPQALKIFQSIPENTSQQTFQMNKYYCQLKQNPSEALIVEQLLSELQNKSKQYIINVIKYLKSKNMPEQVLKCCEQLTDQKNDNTFVKIQCVKALLKLGQIGQAAQVRQSIPKDKITDAVAERLKRKQTYAEARIAKSQKKFDNAASYCQKLVREKESPSACYSLASSYYNQQKWQQAQKYINKAIAQKQVPKYQKLKLYIHIMKKQLDQAKAVLSGLPKNYIDSKIAQMLNQLGSK